MLNSLYCLGIPQTQRLTTRANMSLHTLLLKSSMILIWVVVIYCFVCLSSVTKAQSIKADSLTVESHYKCPRKTVKRRSSVLGMCFSMWPDLAIFFMKLFCANVAQTFGNFGFLKNVAGATFGQNTYYAHIWSHWYFWRVLRHIL